MSCHVIRVVRMTGPEPFNVQGVDFTPAMCKKANAAARLCGHGSESFTAVEGAVDCAGLPAQLEAAGLVKQGTADLVISNGVFNLTLDKRQAFLNAFKLLKPGACFILVDMVREMGEGGRTVELQKQSWAD